MSHGIDEQNNHRRSPAMIAAAPIMKLGQAEYESAIHGALRRGFGHHRNPVGRIAEVANSNVSTARNWWERKCAPGGLHLLRLIAGEPIFPGARAARRHHRRAAPAGDSARAAAGRQARRGRGTRRG